MSAEQQKILGVLKRHRFNATSDSAKTGFCGGPYCFPGNGMITLDEHEDHVAGLVAALFPSGRPAEESSLGNLLRLLREDAEATGRDRVSHMGDFDDENGWNDGRWLREFANDLMVTRTGKVHDPNCEFVRGVNSSAVRWVKAERTPDDTACSRCLPGGLPAKAVGA